MHPVYIIGGLVLAVLLAAGVAFFLQNVTLKNKD